MTKYDIAFSGIEDRYILGLIDDSTAEALNDLAYNKYCMESVGFFDELDEITEESVKAKIGAIERELPEKKNMIKKWGLKQRKPKVIDRDDVSNKDFEKIKSLFDKMIKEDKYSIYKKYFDEVSRLLGIKPSVIMTYKCTKGKEPNKNHIYIRYEEKHKKVTIPNGSGLFHISPCATIKELIPKFKGKSPRCYFYSTPRVYCSIKKDMGKGYAQFKGNQKDVSVTKYKIRENIKTACLDDRIGNVFSGAVYIETRFPIKVDKIVQ